MFFTNKRVLEKLPINRNQILFICAFVYSFSLNILSFSLIYILTDRFSFSAGQVGAALALGTAFYFTGCNLYQRFFNRYRPKMIIPPAVFCCFLSALFLGLTKSGAAAIAAWSLIQGSTGFFWPPVMAWFTQGASEAQLNRDISWYNRAWMAGLLLGPLAGGILYHQNITLVFAAVLFLLLSIIALLVFYACFTEAGLSDNITGRRDERKNKLPAAEILENFGKSLRMFKIKGWIGAASVNIFSGVLGNVIPLYIRDNLGYTEQTAGTVMLFRGIAGLAAFTFFARFTFWHFNRRWFLTLQVFLVLTALLFAVSGKAIPLYMFLAAAFGFFYAGCYNNSIFHSGADKKNPAKNMAFHEIFLSIGAAAGSLGGGLCFQYLGLANLFLLLAFIEAASLGVQVLLDRRIKA
jgi:predicted MFS family arabinose efflux permease